MPTTIGNGKRVLHCRHCMAYNRDDGNPKAKNKSILTICRLSSKQLQEAVPTVSAPLTARVVQRTGPLLPLAPSVTPRTHSNMDKAKTRNDYRKVVYQTIQMCARD